MMKDKERLLDRKTPLRFIFSHSICETTKGILYQYPVGKYNPDWAIAFEDGKVKHIYFIAETKGETNSLQFSEADLRETEKVKKRCAEEHFKAISSDNVKYGVVSSYEELYNIVSK